MVLFGIFIVLKIIDRNRLNTIIELIAAKQKAPNPSIILFVLDGS
tara:strand:- start:74 stop:208 length:135 start_codon:yes stop_codon:yes gene_type:complete